MPKHQIIPNVWARLQQTEPRGKILYEELQEYLVSKDRVLDLNCGYAPLAGHFLSANHKVTGMDLSGPAINELEQREPQGEWKLLNIEKLYSNVHKIKDFEILLQLGVYNLQDEKEYQIFLHDLLQQKQPRIVLLEAAIGACSIPAEADLYMNIYGAKDKVKRRWAMAYNKTIDTLLKNNYKVMKHKLYDAGLENSDKWTKLRIFSIFKKGS